MINQEPRPDEPDNTPQELVAQDLPQGTIPVQVDFSHVGESPELDPDAVAVMSNTEYTNSLLAGDIRKGGAYHPAQTLLDQIDIASSFPTADCGHKIRALVKQVRALL